MTSQAFTSAAYYALFSDSHARIEREAPFLEQLFHAIPGIRIADIACGTGLHAAFFAGLGAEVVATDLSPDMIAQAKRSHPHERVVYRIGDMTTTSGGPYDLVICLGNSLSLLKNDAQLTETFLSIGRCLSEGGIFLAQTLNYDRPESRKPRQRIACGTVDGDEVVGIKNLVPHGDRTLLAITWFTMTYTPTTRTDTAVLRHLPPHLLATAAEQAGLEQIHLYGNYDRSPFDRATSPDMISVFKRNCPLR